MNMEGKAGRTGYCPGAQLRSAGRCSFRHGKSRTAGGEIFTEGKRQTNRRGNLRRRESAGWTDGEISVEGKVPEGTCLKSMNMEGKARRAGYCPGAQCRSAGRCSFRHGKSRAADEGIFTEGEAPEGTCLKSMDMEGEAGRTEYRPRAQRRSAGRCSLRHRKKPGGRQGNLHRGEAPDEPTGKSP